MKRTRGHVIVYLYKDENPEVVYQTKHYRRSLNDYGYAEKIFSGVTENNHRIEEEEVWR